MALLDAILAAEPGHRQALVAKIDSLASRERFGEALDVLDAALTFFPDALALGIKRGTLLRQAGRLEESVDHLRTLTSRHPKEIDARLQLATSLRLAGAEEASLAVVEDVLAIAPGNRPALIARIDALARQRRFAEAVEALEATVALYPDALAMGIKQGVLLRQAGRTGDSVAHLRALVARHPEALEAQMQLSMSLRIAGDTAESLSLLDTVLEAEPNHRPALAARVDTLAALRRFPEALAALETALSRFADDLALRIRKGILLRQAGEVDASIDHLRTLVSQAPQSAEAALQLATSLRQADRHEESARLVEAVLEMQPGNRQALMARVDALANRQLYGEALAALDASIALFPDALAVGTKRGILLRQAGRSDASVDQFRSLLRQHPQASEIKLQLAVSLRQAGTHAESLALVDDVLAAEPGNRAANLAKVETLAIRAQFVEALAALDAALSLYPDDAALALRRGTLLRQAGRLEESADHLRALLSRHPQAHDARMQLATVLRLLGAHDESRAELETLLKAAPDNRQALHQLASVQLGSGAPLDALATANTALRDFPDDVEIGLQRADILIHLDRMAEGIAQLHATFRACPGSAVVAPTLIDTLAQRWRHADALDVFRAFVAQPAADDAARMAQVNLCVRYGEIGKANALAERWVEAQPGSSEARLALYIARSESPRPDDLAALETELQAAIGGSSRLTIARARRRRFEFDFAGATAILQAHLDEFPEARDVQIHFFQFLLDIDDLDRCLTLVDSLAMLPAYLLFNLADRLQWAGRRDDVDRLLPRLEATIDGTPSPRDRLVLQRYLCTLLARKNDLRTLAQVVAAALASPSLDRAGKDYFQHFQREYLGLGGEERTTRDAEPEARGRQPLRSLLEGDAYLPAQASIPRPEAIALTRRISPPEPGGYDAWLRRYLKGWSVNHVVATSYATMPENLDAFDGLIEFPAIHMLEDHAARSEPFLVAGTHQGPLTIVWRLLQSFPNLRVVASEAPWRRDHPISRALLPMGFDTASVRNLIVALRKGSPVAATLDQAYREEWGEDTDANSVELKLFDYPSVRVPNLVPRIAWKMNLPSYWIQDYRQDGKVTIELARLPDPDYGVDRATWIARWAAAYGRHYENVLKTGPDNLTFYSTYLQEIANRWAATPGGKAT